MKTKQITLDLDPTAHEMLTKAAEFEKTTPSNIVEQFLFGERHHELEEEKN